MNAQTIYGLKNEENIINYLNKKRIGDLNNKWKKHILKMFPFAKENDLVLAKHFPNYNAKPDIAIKIRYSIKYVSIKTGKIPSMHQESYYSFMRFLRKLGVSERTISIIRFFHYGDSKKLHTNGKPLSFKEMKEKYSDYFLQASKELDTEKIISAVVDRSVIRGTSYKNTAIDYLYYGDLEHGNLIDCEEIYEIVLAYRMHGKSPIHFGGLNYMPNARSLKRRERNYVRIKWPLLALFYYRSEEDIEKMKVGAF